MGLFSGLGDIGGNIWEMGSPTSSSGGGGGGGGPGVPNPIAATPAGGTWPAPIGTPPGQAPESAFQMQIQQLLQALSNPEMRRQMAGQLAMQVGNPPQLPQSPPPYIPMQQMPAPAPAGQVANTANPAQQSPFAGL